MLWLLMMTSGSHDQVVLIVLWAIVGFCVVVGAWTFIIGRRSSITPIWLRPLVLAVAAALLVLGITL